MALGVFLSGKVVPDPAKSITIETTENKNTSSITQNSPVTPRSKIQPELLKLKNESAQLQQEARQIIKKADVIVAQSGFVASNKNMAPDNDAITKRIQSVKARLDVLGK
jgi:2-phospho-L-lactate transferase/gluconeogenesis factor (CofD/UPF0052 family)